MGNRLQSNLMDERPESSRPSSVGVDVDHIRVIKPDRLAKDKRDLTRENCKLKMANVTLNSQNLERTVAHDSLQVYLDTMTQAMALSEMVLYQTGLESAEAEEGPVDT